MGLQFFFPNAFLTPNLMSGYAPLNRLTIFLSMNIFFDQKYRCLEWVNDQPPHREGIVWQCVRNRKPPRDGIVHIWRGIALYFPQSCSIQHVVGDWGRRCGDNQLFTGTFFNPPPSTLLQTCKTFGKIINFIIFSPLLLVLKSGG